jgi:hypothetical protein
MITCSCGEENFKIVERGDKAIIMCSGCGNHIVETNKCNLKLNGFKTEGDQDC